MNTKPLSQDEILKLRLRAAELKHQILEVQSALQKLRRTEKKKKMKESTPPPLKERKEIRKEVFYNNYNNKKGNSENSKKNTSRETVFTSPTLDEVQAYMDEIGEHRFTAVNFWNYYEAKGWVLGKSRMVFWKRVLDNWSNRENERVKRKKGAILSAQQNIVTFNAFKPVNTTGAVSYTEYERMKKEGKSLTPNLSPEGEGNA